MRWDGGGGMRGFKLVLLLGLFGANCRECKQVCCELPDGTHDLRALGRCEGDGGVEQDDVECDEIGDPDVDLPDTDETDPPDDTDVPDTDVPDTDPPEDTDAPTCAAFCAGILEVCPSDTACEESCLEYATLPVTDEAVQCAADAETCPQTGACWDLLGL